MTSLCFSRLRTGGLYCLICHHCMSRCRNCNIFNFLSIHFGFIVVILTTFFAMPVFNVSVFRTGSFFCFHKCHFMSGCRDCLSFALATSVTPEELYSILCTSRFLHDSSCIPVMSQRLDHSLLLQHCVTYRTMASFCLSGFCTGGSHCCICYYRMTLGMNYNLRNFLRIFGII